MTAQATSLTSEEVIKQSVALLLPAFEADIPEHLRLSPSKLSLLNDMQLWKTANAEMEKSKQSRLEKLAEIRKSRDLTDEEQSEISDLMGEAQQLMLHKAEARRILSQRGHSVFHPAAP
jgi:hypothetical protein